LIGKRDIHNWVATIYANVIGPGMARIVHYRFRVPAGVAITELEATLNYRKFTQEYNQFVFEDKEVPVQPIIAMSTARRQAGSAPEAHRPLWERWNDYGIGLFLEGDTKRALAAFQKVTEIAPKNPEGPINQGRVLTAEGQVDRALEILREAEARKPGYLKTTYFRGAVYKKMGEYDQALADWKKVAEAYPKDRVVPLDIGRLEYLSGRFEEALRWIDHVLAIDPEDLGGLYNRMLTLAPWAVKKKWPRRAGCMSITKMMRTPWPLPQSSNNAIPQRITKRSRFTRISCGRSIRDRILPNRRLRYMKCFPLTHGRFPAQPLR
jgi:tetratricopeptide (TPR) repeat protein